MFGLHQYDDIVYHKYNLAQPTILTPMQLKVFCLHYTVFPISPHSERSSQLHFLSTAFRC